MSEASCRRAVMERAERMCERCWNVTRGVTIHHRRKRSQGGGWDISNCVALCGHGTTMGGCHSWVEANPNAAEEEGWHVRPWGDAATTPVLYRGRWALLLPDGGIQWQ